MLNKLDFLNNQEVTILCSGNSSNNHIDDKKIVIVPNRSILMPQLVNYEKIIWVNGTGWMRNNVLSWWKQLAREIKTHPDYMLVRYEPGHEMQYIMFEKEFKNLLPYTKIEKIPISHTTDGVLSTGMRCIEFAIDSEASRLLVAGMEMGKDTKYSSVLMKNEVILKKGDDSFTRHLKSDIRYLSNLNRQEIRKITPVKNSGLYSFINEGF